MTKHFADGFDGDSVCEGNGGCESMPGTVECDGLIYSGFFGYGFDLAEMYGTFVGMGNNLFFNLLL